MIILFIFMIITLKINIKVFYTLSTIKLKKLFFIIAKKKNTEINDPQQSIFNKRNTF